MIIISKILIGSLVARAALIQTVAVISGEIT